MSVVCLKALPYDWLFAHFSGAMLERQRRQLEAFGARPYTHMVCVYNIYIYIYIYIYIAVVIIILIIIILFYIFMLIYVYYYVYHNIYIYI